MNIHEVNHEVKFINCVHTPQLFGANWLGLGENIANEILLSTININLCLVKFEVFSILDA